MRNNNIVLDFIVNTNWSQFPEIVQLQSKRCLLDTLGAQIAGHMTPVADLMADFAAEQFKGTESTIYLS